MVENFAMAQSLILLALSIDRYLNLIDSYSSYLKRPFCFITINILIPYLLAFIVFDYYVLKLQFGEFHANIIKYEFLKLCFTTFSFFYLNILMLLNFFK